MQPAFPDLFVQSFRYQIYLDRGAKYQIPGEFLMNMNKTMKVVAIPFALLAMPAVMQGLSAQESDAPTVDTDGDGTPDAWDKSGDGKADAWDTNGDGKADAWDTDGNGKPDAYDTDGDGQPETMDKDEDGTPDQP